MSDVREKLVGLLIEEQLPFSWDLLDEANQAVVREGLSALADKILSLVSPALPLFENGEPVTVMRAADVDAIWQDEGAWRVAVGLGGDDPHWLPLNEVALEVERSESPFLEDWPNLLVVARRHSGQTPAPPAPSTPERSGDEGGELADLSFSVNPGLPGHLNDAAFALRQGERHHVLAKDVEQAAEILRRLLASGNRLRENL